MALRPPIGVNGVPVDGSDERLRMGSLLTPSSLLRARGGSLGGPLVVAAQGTPNMTVSVPSFAVVVDGAGFGTGACVLTNIGPVIATIPAASSTNPRLDLVCVRWTDSTVTPDDIFVVAGTAAAVPARPAIPANSVALAVVAVAKSVLSISNAAITNLTVQTTMLGGITPSRSAVDVAGVYVGQYRDNTASGGLERWNGTGWEVVTARLTDPGYWQWGGFDGYGPWHIPSPSWVRAPGATGFFFVQQGHVYQITSQFSLRFDWLNTNASGDVRSSIQVIPDAGGAPAPASGAVLIEAWSVPTTSVLGAGQYQRPVTHECLLGHYYAPVSGPVWFSTEFATNNVLSSVYTPFTSPQTNVVDLGPQAPFVNCLHM